ncbi:hypothetical protein OJJOAM_004488 [Cupriavidus sp. H18C1]
MSVSLAGFSWMPPKATTNESHEAHSNQKLPQYSSRPPELFHAKENIRLH